MLKTQRQQRIRELLRHQREVRVEPLAERFEVSAMTIRRDLNELAAAGDLERTYGGAVAVQQTELPVGSGLSRRLATQADEKTAMARHVAGMIGHGESIYLSPGSSTYFLAQALAPRQDLVVITNSLLTAYYLAEASEMTVIMLGGAIRREHMSLARIFTADNLRELNLDRVIVGCEGIHPVYGISNSVPPEYGTDRTVIGPARRAIVLADYSKLGQVADYNVAPIEMVKTLVTAGVVTAAMVAAFQKQGVEVINVSRS